MAQGKETWLGAMWDPGVQPGTESDHQNWSGNGKTHEIWKEVYKLVNDT